PLPCLRLQELRRPVSCDLTGLRRCRESPAETAPGARSRGCCRMRSWARPWCREKIPIERATALAGIDPRALHRPKFDFLLGIEFVPQAAIGLIEDVVPDREF